MSKTPVAQRIRQMEQMGLITGYRAMVSQLKLWLTHVTYVEAKMTNTCQGALDNFNEGVRQIEEVEECYMITFSPNSGAVYLGPALSAFDPQLCVDGCRGGAELTPL